MHPAINSVPVTGILKLAVFWGTAVTGEAEPAASALRSCSKAPRRLNETTHTVVRHGTDSLVVTLPGSDVCTFRDLAPWTSPSPYIRAGCCDGIPASLQTPNSLSELIYSKAH